MKGPLTQHQWSNPCYQFEQDLRQGKISQHVDRNGLYTLNKFFFLVYNILEDIKMVIIGC